MSRLLIISKVKEIIEINNAIFNDKRLKRCQFNLGKAHETPVITTIFGEYENPLCHMRLDLN